MDTLFGLPAHPLLVHIPIVLLPLAAVGLVVMVLRQDWYRRFRWPVLAIAAVGTLGAVLAASAGEELERRITAVEGAEAASSWAHHAELGDTARLVSIIFLVLLAAYVLVPWWIERRSSMTPAVGPTDAHAGGSADAVTHAHAGGGTTPIAVGRALRITLAALAVVGAAASVTTVVQAGHTGSKSVWEDYVSKTSRD